MSQICVFFFFTCLLATAGQWPRALSGFWQPRIAELMLWHQAALPCSFCLRSSDGSFPELREREKMVFHHVLLVNLPEPDLPACCVEDFMVWAQAPKADAGAGNMPFSSQHTVLSPLRVCPLPASWYPAERMAAPTVGILHHTPEWQRHDEGTGAQDATGKQHCWSA